MTQKEKQDLRRLYREAFDMVFDLRHYQRLCRRARQLDQPPWLVLMAILERVFRDEIDTIDDLIDRPLAGIRSVLERVRQQPDKVELLSRRRIEEIANMAEAYPEETTDEDRLFFTNLLVRVTERDQTLRDRQKLESLVSKLKKKGNRS